jgi:serine protease Do
VHLKRRRENQNETAPRRSANWDLLIILLTVLGVTIMLWAGHRRIARLERTAEDLLARVEAQEMAQERENNAFLEILDVVQQSVVLVQARGRAGESFGTGFVAEPGGYVATCEHIVRGAREVQVFALRGEEYTAHPATVAAASQEYDIAILQVPELRTARALWLGSVKQAHWGANVIVFGFPNPDRWQAAFAFHGGIARKGLHTVEGWDRYALWLDLRSPRGCSGAPVLLARTGEVIGMQYGVVDPDRAEGVAVAIAVDLIEQMLQTAQGQGTR